MTWTFCGSSFLCALLLYCAGPCLAQQNPETAAPSLAAPATPAAPVAPATPAAPEAPDTPALPNAPKAPPSETRKIGQVTKYPVPRFVSLKATKAYLRRGPGRDYRIDAVYTWRGMPLKIIGEYGLWRQVEDVDGVTGWVFSSLLTGVRTVFVTLNDLEGRSGPDERAPVVIRAHYGALLRLLTCEGVWCKVTAQGETAWMPRNALWGILPDEAFN